MPKKELDLEKGDVAIRIESAHREPALKTKICAPSELVEEILASEPDKFL